MKYLTEKSFRMLGGVPLTPLSTLTNFFDRLMKNTFFIISIFFTQQLAGIV